jgi:hypothetical protein
MGKGSKRKIKDAEDGKPAVYKFQRQRCKWAKYLLGVCNLNRSEDS